MTVFKVKRLKINAGLNLSYDNGIKGNVSQRLLQIFTVAKKTVGINHLINQKRRIR